MLERVISGGQCGADLGGLLAAVKAGIPTGGYAPKGWRTEKGPDPRLARLGLKQTNSTDYRERTTMNVEHSDATLILAADFSSAGTQLTKQLCCELSRPYYPILFGLEIIDPNGLQQWLQALGVRTLNVAGNRESVAPGITRFAVQFLTPIFRRLK